MASRSALLQAILQIHRPCLIRKRVLCAPTSAKMNHNSAQFLRPLLPQTPEKQEFGRSTLAENRDFLTFPPWVPEVEELRKGLQPKAIVRNVPEDRYSENPGGPSQKGGSAAK